MRVQQTKSVCNYLNSEFKTIIFTMKHWSPPITVANQQPSTQWGSCRTLHLTQKQYKSGFSYKILCQTGRPKTTRSFHNKGSNLSHIIHVYHNSHVVANLVILLFFLFSEKLIFNQYFTQHRPCSTTEVQKPEFLARERLKPEYEEINITFWTALLEKFVKALT